MLIAGQCMTHERRLVCRPLPLRPKRAALTGVAGLRSNGPNSEAEAKSGKAVVACCSADSVPPLPLPLTPVALTFPFYRSFWG
jgi:hypothetical protein